MSRPFPLELTEDRSVSVYMNKIEIGQGIQTAIAQIAAEELDVPIEWVRARAPDTEVVTEGSSTTGSNSIQGMGASVRQAAADIRYAALRVAATAWGLGAEELEVTDGRILGPEGQVTDYWEIDLSDQLELGAGSPKSAADYRIVGKSIPREDLPLKVLVGGQFVHDLCPDGLLHGRVIRPPSYDAILLKCPELDDSTVRLVRDGSFVGVVGESEAVVVSLTRDLADSCEWDVRTQLPDQAGVYEDLLAKPDRALLVEDGKPGGTPVPDIEIPAEAEKTVHAEYYRPYQMHGALAPSAAMARFDAPGLIVWSHSQGVFALREALAQVLEIPTEDVRVLHAESSGCYGHNGADDVALDAALIARSVPGSPVLVKWSRHDEHAWEPYGSCAVLKMQASLDASGVVADWNHDVWSYTHSSRPRSGGETSSLLAARYLANPIPVPEPTPGRGAHSGIHRNADPLYAFRRKRVVKHFVPDSPLRVSALRGLGSFANVFAIESFMDELAHAAAQDPVAFRLAYLEDERAVAVIRCAAEAARWGRSLDPSRGLGIGFAQYKNEKAYVAVCADVTVQTTGQIQLNKMTIAGDVGQVINPDGVKSQLEGGVVQAASWTLKEEVTFSRDRITSVNWETYPVLRFDEVPEVETLLVDRQGFPSLGCGEATQGPTPAAIANAVYNACGIRLRQIPFTPERVLAASQTIQH